MFLLRKPVSVLGESLRFKCGEKWFCWNFSVFLYAHTCGTRAEEQHILI